MFTLSKWFLDKINVPFYATQGLSLTYLYSKQTRTPHQALRWFD